MVKSNYSHSEEVTHKQNSMHSDLAIGHTEHAHHLHVACMICTQHMQR